MFCVFGFVSTSVCIAESLKTMEDPFVMVLPRLVCLVYLDDLDTVVCDIPLRNNLKNNKEKLLILLNDKNHKL